MKTYGTLLAFFLGLLLMAQEPNILNTTAIGFSDQGEMVLAHAQTKTVDIRTPEGALLYQFSLEDPPTGIALRGQKLYVTTSHTQGSLHIFDLEQRSMESIVPLPMGARSPQLAPDGKTLYVCNQWVDAISAIDLSTHKVRTLKVLREPRDLVVSLDGKTLYVSNFLPDGRADGEEMSSKISVIDLGTFTVKSHISLTNGSNAIRGLGLSPDGKYVFATHNLGRFQVPTTQLQQGWMNTSAVSVIDTENQKLLGSFLTDLPERGMAGIWDVLVTPDRMFLSHSGTHELSCIDYTQLVSRFMGYGDAEGLSYDLNFLKGIRKVIPIPGNGPRSMAIQDGKVYVVSYFSDQVHSYDIGNGLLSTIALNPNFSEDLARKGERIFNDATNCFQTWQSCNGCHPGQGRVDGLNWDLLNDGIGNPKNCKSLLFSHATAPAMITGIRPDAETAVRAGFTHIQFAEIPEADAQAVDAYLKSLQPLPSPVAEDESMAKTIEQGKKIFESKGCTQCHYGPYFTDGNRHQIGEIEFEAGWDTPSLREVWRTAPYLHDGRAATLTDLFQVHGHGLGNKPIKKKDLKALVTYIKSL